MKAPLEAITASKEIKIKVMGREKLLPPFLFHPFNSIFINTKKIKSFGV